MIALNYVGWQSHSWQWLLSHAITDINKLVSLLDLPALAVDTSFPLLVPMPFVGRMQRGDRDDPLLRQVLPREIENTSTPGYVLDPLQESGASPVKGMLQKYHGRVLIVATGACAVNCRYCFRRHFPYQSFQPDHGEWDKIFTRVAADASIREVILSGGDPLVLPDRRLREIAQQLSNIPHLTTLRIHTRLPVVIPQRVCDEMLDWVSRSRLRIVIVIHANHANEIDGDVAVATAGLRSAGATLLNQSVLLQGVNDCADALSDLSLRLFEIGVLPYYLHALDPVAGAAHFDVTSARAKEIMAQITARLPGYLVPRFVREIPGASGKVSQFL